MKKSLLTLLGCLLVVLQAGAGWITSSLNFGGKTRAYRIYVPDVYSETQPATLIVALHGLGGSMEDISYTGLSSIADTANIIIAAPQALDFDSPYGVIPAAWNNGIAVFMPGFGTVAVNGDIDDMGFIGAMMDTVLLRYNIREHRSYVCGMSMGGFMTQRLACELSNRFDAVASVAGTYALALPECTPSDVLPVAHFHGTADSVVTYEGLTPFPFLGYVPVGLDVNLLIDKWKTINGCLPDPEAISLPDVNGDGLSMDHFIYTNASGRSMVELFRINGGEHTWYLSGATGGEFDYAEEIWKFFNRQYRITALENTPAVIYPEVYPNPVMNRLYISNVKEIAGLTLYDISGKVIIKQEGDANAVNTEALQPGTYLIEVRAKDGRNGMSKFIKL